MEVKINYLVIGAVVAAAIALILGFNQTISQTASALSLPKNSIFVAAGDWGCKSSTAGTVSTAVKLNPNLVLALGDLSYQGNTDCWENIIKPIFSKTRIVIGNHDVVDPEMTANYTRDFNLRNQYYSFNYNNVHVVVLSSEIAYGTSSSQYAFVKADLSQAASNSSINWIIAAVHKPIYTSSSNQPAPADLRATFSPLFDKYGVDLVLAGHNHNYQRTYPLAFNANNPGSPIIKSYSKTCYYDPSGPIYLISGAGGQSHAYLGSQKSFVIRQFSDKYGVSKIDITNIQNSSGQMGTIMSLVFYQNGKLGTPIDPFKITKGAAATNIC